MVTHFCTYVCTSSFCFVFFERGVGEGGTGREGGWGFGANDPYWLFPFVICMVPVLQSTFKVCFIPDKYSAKEAMILPSKPTFLCIPNFPWRIVSHTNHSICIDWQMVVNLVYIILLLYLVPICVIQQSTNWHHNHYTPTSLYVPNFPW